MVYSHHYHSTGEKGDMDTSNLTVLGKVVQKTLTHVETFDAPAGLSFVTMISDEVVTFCPVTSQKDLYTVSIAMFLTDDVSKASRSNSISITSSPSKSVSLQKN